MMSFSQDLFSENGALSRELDGYEVRIQQTEMVKAVEEAIEGQRHLIVEAGTGVGKSLAYLVPFIEWSVRNDRRVVISTYTKALQNQLFVKDLPFLKRVMGVDFSYSLCMGSENYVCRRKTGRCEGAGLYAGKGTKEQFEKILNWVQTTESGRITDMDFVPDPAVWAKFRREADICGGRKCPFSGNCFYRKARIEQGRSNILVTNHSLLFSDMMTEARVLPEFHALVLDEAHTLEDVATGHLGKEASDRGLKYVVDGIAALLKRPLTPANGAESEMVSRLEEVKTFLKDLKKVSKEFFAEAEDVFGTSDRTLPLEREKLFHHDLSGPVAAVATSLRSLSVTLDEESERDEVSGYAERCDRFEDAMDFIFGHESAEYVYWVDIRARRKKPHFCFHAAPIDISRHLRERLFGALAPIILTSATLSTAGGGADFNFIKERLGIDDPLELSLDSPYEYSEKVLLYMPAEVPDPNRQYKFYKERVTEEIIRLYDILGGRMFSLFTSYEMMNDVRNMISKKRGDIDILKQGDLPRYVLLDVFKKDRCKVLMGTSTFWQGVDVPGDALECVIITKLPFAVPSDPVTAARIKALRDVGENPFVFYQLPRALIMFKQGFGRLVRGHNDRGVVAVLDPRIKGRHYGSYFLRILPDCRRTREIGDVRGFFRGIRSGDKDDTQPCQYH